MNGRIHHRCHMTEMEDQLVVDPPSEYWIWFDRHRHTGFYGMQIENGERRAESNFLVGAFSIFLLWTVDVAPPVMLVYINEKFWCEKPLSDGSAGEPNWKNKLNSEMPALDISAYRSRWNVLPRWLQCNVTDGRIQFCNTLSDIFGLV